jgi:peptidoglycan/xylan/chitin deacetylase (PgdA/CDA1 family)
VSASSARTPSDTRSLWPWLAGAVVAIIIAVALAAWGLSRPLNVTVDGVTRTVEARSTLGDLREQGLLNSRPGRLLSVEGKVLRARGGGSAAVKRNGRPVEMSQRLFDGDIIVSHDGADKTEKTTTRREAVSIPVVHEGVGPVVALRRLGAPGVVVVTTGKISGAESTRSVVTTGDAMVVSHRAATSADKLVALTFDDGPWPGQTEKILDVLKRQNVRATFFMLGRSARNSPDLARRVLAEGHTVGSHSLGHKQLTKLKTPAAIRKEISSGVSAIAGVTGVRPVWFRPPYGAVNGAFKKQIRVLKLRTAMWDIDTLDWTKPGVHTLYRNAVRSTQPGDIVLMHDGGANRTQTIEALPLIIEDLRAKGYTLVTLDELAAAK